MADSSPPDSQPPGPSSSSMNGTGSSNRSELIAKLVSEVLERRLNGELVRDADVIDHHKDLMPELAEELEALQRIAAAVRDGKKAGPLHDAAPSDSTNRNESDNGNGNGRGSSSQVEEEPVKASIEGYYIERVLSRGGQATVFEGVQASTGRKVAIKIIYGGSFTSTDRRARFEREADILAGLDHPNIVRITDRGRTSDGSFFFAMDLVEGPTLEDYLKPKVEQDLRPVLELFVVIADAVHEAHRNGIVHRDLKPSNIRIDGRGAPHVLDFGLARLLEEDEFDSGAPLTITGQVVGSLPWASPEQARGAHREVDARSDVYSLGVMLYQALAGSFPYKLSGTFREVQDTICRCRPTPLKIVAKPPLGPVDGALEAIVLRALEKNKTGRYASTADLAVDLKNYLRGTVVEAAVAHRHKKRRPILIVTIVLVLLLGGTFLWFHRLFSGLPRYTNPQGMEFVQLPAGHFKMGSPESEAGRQKSELQHDVVISTSYFMGANEVTIGQFIAITGINPGNPLVKDLNAPVQGVNYDDAVNFCRLLGAKDGNEYRLPTDAEWEYACRAGSTGYLFGDSDDLGQIAWYQKNSQDGPHPVRSKKPNAWGLYDMIGNAREWCLDGPRTYTSASATDPRGPMNGPFKVVRGGSWSSTAQLCRAAHRSDVGTAHRIEDGGFRVVMVRKH